MEDTVRVTGRDVEREARWLREAGHHFPACVLEGLWRELAADGRDCITLGRGAMTADDIGNLKPGDQVRHLLSGESYVVTASHGDRATAARTADLTNPCEWERVVDAK